MSRQLRHKQERIVEALRLGLDGEDAVEAIRKAGYALTPAAFARQLKTMGGRPRVEALLAEGKSNIEILEICVPGEDLEHLKHEPPSEAEALDAETGPSKRTLSFNRPDGPVYETTKLTVHLPADVYEAVRLAAKGEGKTQNQLIVDLLTQALSRMPDQDVG